MYTYVYLYMYTYVVLMHKEWEAEKKVCKHIDILSE